MRRTTVAAIALALLLCLVGTAVARSSHHPVDVERVYRDCARDGRLDGHYEQRVLRRALREMPADLAEYSACPRTIRRALSVGEARAMKQIYRQCTHEGRVHDGFPRRTLQRALREMPADLAEYSACPRAIRAALRRTRHAHG